MIALQSVFKYWIVSPQLEVGLDLSIASRRASKYIFSIVVYILFDPDGFYYLLLLRNLISVIRWRSS